MTKLNVVENPVEGSVVVNVGTWVVSVGYDEDGEVEVDVCNEKKGLHEVYMLGKNSEVASEDEDELADAEDKDE